MPVKKFLLVAAVVLAWSPAHAKTFVGVLWPMFGPLPAIGLVELAGQLKMMPDVEVRTYLHQEWPALVQDIDRQPAGTRTVVVGYSLGANSSVFVANKARYVDLIIALQPSMLSWNPSLTGRVGRMIEIYNPNPMMTFGGMGSKKLIGKNIEYIANNDSHPGAQFNPQFRELVKTEVAKLTAGTSTIVAQDDTPANPPKRQVVATAKPAVVTAQVETPLPPKRPIVAQDDPPPQRHQAEAIAFLDALSRSVNAGDLTAQRRLTAADMTAYAQRTYRASAPAGDDRPRAMRVRTDRIASSEDPERDSRHARD